MVWSVCNLNIYCYIYKQGIACERGRTPAMCKGVAAAGLPGNLQRDLSKRESRLRVAFLATDAAGILLNNIVLGNIVLVFIPKTCALKRRYPIRCDI